MENYYCTVKQAISKNYNVLKQKSSREPVLNTPRIIKFPFTSDLISHSKCTVTNLSDIVVPLTFSVVQDLSTLFGSNTTS